VQPAAAYLDSLNPEQRRAVEHGATGAGPFAPLLVIAGAGSGKTNTLAHRVAHLIVSGADPRRILLMTFSRRAASEMTKRVERIARKVMGDNAGVMTDTRSPGPAPSTASAPACCATTPTRSVSIPSSRSMIVRIPPT
jgi:DNA helicase-2/ATP-dependent DNA helicase PcrA